MQYERNSVDKALDALLSLPRFQSNEKINKSQFNQEKKPTKATTTRQQTVSAMKNYAKRLDLDVDKLSVIHVAGTKGKGSTCSMVESILRKSGYKTGLFTSPHLISPNERFRINGVPVTDDVFLLHFWAVWDGLHNSVDESEDFPPIANFFRFVTLVAVRIFLEESVDVAILEVGLGGRLDATNFIDKPVVCGVTTLDLDHTHVLGNTLELIAREKAGIFKRNVPAFTVRQEASAALVLQETAQKCGNPLFVVPELDGYGPKSSKIMLGLKGDYQKINASLAISLASTWLNSKESSEKKPKYESMVNQAILDGLEKAFWPGRSQTVERADMNSFFYLDGAHTLRSMECCVDWFNQCMMTKETTTRVLLFHCAHERDIATVIQPLLKDSFDYVLFTPVESGRPSIFDIPTAKEVLMEIGINDVAPDSTIQVYGNSTKDLKWQRTLAEVWHSLRVQRNACQNKIIVMSSIADSMAFLKLKADSVGPLDILVTGSLYLVGDTLSILDWKI